jgi:hypothetical protein
VDHGGERLERDDRDRLEQLLVGPPRLARLLEQVARTHALLGERAQIAQQRGLAVIARVPLTGERELVEAEPGLAPGARVQREAGLGAVQRRDGERDPLERLERQRAVVAQLRAEPRVGAQGGRGARQDAEEVRQLAGAGEGAFDDRQRRLGRRQVVVDLEAGHLCLHCEPPWGEGAGGALDSASLPLISVGPAACLRNRLADLLRTADQPPPTPTT